MTRFFFGKKRAFKSQIEPYLEDLYRLAYRLCRNTHDAEDIVQDLVLKIHAQKIDIGQYDNPRTWLSKVLFRHYIDQYRHNIRSPIQHAEDLAKERDTDNVLDTYESNDLPLLEQAENDRFMTALQVALEQLNEEQRTLIILFEVEGYSLNEIQEILELPQGTIKSRLHRARASLRQQLEKYGTDSTSQACNTARSQS